MANIFQREPTDGGDSGVWGPKELKQNRLSLGAYSCRLYDDSGTLKITVGKIGFNNGSSQGAIDVDTVTSISLGASTSIWLKVEVSVSGGTPSFTATAIPGATDPGTIPAGFSGGFDNSKAGYYMIATARTLGLAWVNAAGTLEGVVNSYPGMEGYYGYSLTDDALDWEYTWDVITGLEYDGAYLGRAYLIPESERSSSFILNGGNAAVWTDIDFSPHVPYGVVAVIINSLLYMNGDGAVDYVIANYRKNGSAEADSVRTWLHPAGYTNLGAGLLLRSCSTRIVECDLDGIIEYIISTNAAAAALYVNIMGFYLP